MTIDFNKIIQGDCLEVMRQFPSESIDLIVTSPPYNLKNSTGNGMKDGRGGKWKNAELVNGYSHHNDCMPHEEYVKWQRDCLAEMLRLIPENGAIFYNHKWRVQDGLLQDRQDIVGGFPIRQILIWKRKGGINFNQGYFLPTYEVIYI
jgi:modification methylase